MKIDKPPIGDPCNGCGLCCMTQVCGTGSFSLGLVDSLGERAPGPCPVLMQVDGRYSCGLVLRPKDHIDSNRGVSALRSALMVLIGAGAGCDEAGDEPDETAQQKTSKLTEKYVEKTGIPAIIKAKEIIFGDKR